MKFFAFFVLILFSCRSKIQDRLVTQPRDRFDKLSVIHINYPERLWELEADSAELYGDEKVMLKKFKIKIYRQNELSLVINSDYGFFDLKTRDVQTKGKTEILLSDNRKIITKNLEYKHSISKFISNDEAYLDTHHAKVKGTGIIANSDFSDIELKNPIAIKD